MNTLFGEVDNFRKNVGLFILLCEVVQTGDHLDLFGKMYNFGFRG